MRGGSADSPSMVTVPASTSLNIMMGDDSMSDDVFEVDDDKSAINYNLASTSSMSYLPPASPQPYVLQQQHGNYHSLASERLAQAVLPTPSPTGYRDYIPPAEVLEQSNFAKSRMTDNIWSSYKRDDNPENAVHKTILLGDSGVGKTSLLVQFDIGKFQHGNFAATVGIGFTVMLLGDSGVGKTCILTRFRDGQFLSGNYITTVGIDFRNKMVTVDDTQVKLQIWDTAGQERFRSVTHAYYRDAHALLLLYDVTNKQSFDNIRAWLGEIREYAQDNVVIMLLGNKCDCGPERIVRREDGQRLASEYKVPFMETSAKTGLNVELAFHAVARELKARAKKEEGDQDEERFNVQDYLRQQQSQRSSCFNSNCLTT